MNSAHPIRAMLLAASTAALVAAGGRAIAAEAPVVVFVSANSPLVKASLDDIRKAFVGEKDVVGIPVQMALPPLSRDETAVFLKGFLKVSRDGFEQVWRVRQRSFGKSAPRHFEDPGAIRSVVQSYPNTIGVTKATPEELGSDFVVLWRSDKP